MKSEYQTQEYCKSTGCRQQYILDKLIGPNKADLLESQKKKCKTCKVWQFHNWLQSNGYMIIQKKTVNQLRATVRESKKDIEKLKDKIKEQKNEIDHVRGYNEIGPW